jgi:hypothetical protein
LASAATSLGVAVGDEAHRTVADQWWTEREVRREYQEKNPEAVGSANAGCEWYRREMKEMRWTCSRMKNSIK